MKCNKLFLSILFSGFLSAVAFGMERSDNQIFAADHAGGNHKRPHGDDNQQDSSNTATPPPLKRQALGYTVGWEELHIAAKNGNLETVKQILEQNPTLQDLEVATGPNKGFNAAHVAAKAGQVKVLELIVNICGKEVLNTPVKDSDTIYHGCSAVHIAARAGQVGVLKLIVNLCGKEILYTPVTAPGTIWHGCSAAHIAAKVGHIGVIEFIIGCCGRNVLDTPVNAPDTMWHGCSVVHIAVQAGQREVFEFIVNRCGKEILYTPVNAPGARCHGLSAFDIAFESGHGGLGEMIMLAVTYPIKSCLVCEKALKNGDEIVRFCCGHAITGCTRCLIELGNSINKCPLCSISRNLEQEKILIVSQAFLNRASEDQPQIQLISIPQLLNNKVLVAKECSICSEDIEIGDVMLRLSCGHIVCTDLRCSVGYKKCPRCATERDLAKEIVVKITQELLDDCNK